MLISDLAGPICSYLNLDDLERVGGLLLSCARVDDDTAMALGIAFTGRVARQIAPGMYIFESAHTFLWAYTRSGPKTQRVMLSVLGRRFIMRLEQKALDYDCEDVARRCYDLGMSFKNCHYYRESRSIVMFLFSIGSSYPLNGWNVMELDKEPVSVSTNATMWHYPRWLMGSKCPKPAFHEWIARRMHSLMMVGVNCMHVYNYEDSLCAGLISVVQLMVDNGWNPSDVYDYRNVENHLWKPNPCKRWLCNMGCKFYYEDAVGDTCLAL